MMVCVTRILTRRIQVGLTIAFAGSLLLLVLQVVLKDGTQHSLPLPSVSVPSWKVTEEHVQGFTNQLQYQNQDGVAGRERLTSEYGQMSSRKALKSHSNLQQGLLSQRAHGGSDLQRSMESSAMTQQRQQTLVSSTEQSMPQRKQQRFSPSATSHGTLLKDQKTVCTETKTLPKPVIAKIKSYLYFIGHGRSGHSIVGSILDSHPHIVVSHEFNVFSKLTDGNKSCNSKGCLFNALWENSCMSITNGWRSDEMADEKGYTLAIENLYQGAYQSYIDVIGDKKGGTTAVMYMKDHDKFESAFDKLNSIVSLPIKVIHVIRNPYDNIATQVLFKYQRNENVNITTLKKTDFEPSINPGLVHGCIVKYFNVYQSIEEMKVKYNLDVLEVHGQDLIADPKRVIMKLCNFLQVDCPDNFLAVCADKIFPKESKTRYKIKWSDDQISAIKINIQKYENLHRYLDFDS